MEVRRVRFVDVVPSAIRCVRFCGDAAKPRLAVARANGSIEIWVTVDGLTYFRDIWIPGRVDSPVESMLWVGNDLLTAGLGGHLDQWNLKTLKPCHSLDCQGGPVWCIVNNPVSPHTLAVGSDDGMVRLFDYTSSGFAFTRSLHRQESRVLCLAWHKSGEYIVMGGTDSSVRIVHVPSATCTNRITLDNYKEKTTLLWDVTFVGDFFLITASSLGQVQVWDFKHGTLCNTFNQHSADVLTLALLEENGNSTLFASGVDSAIVKISSTVIEDSKISGKRWILSGKIRPHQRDIFSMHLSPAGLLASGGVEGELVITDASQFCKSSYIKYQPFPCMAQQFCLTKGGSLFLFQNLQSLSLWSLSQCTTLPAAASQCVSETNMSKIHNSQQKCLDTSFTPFRLLELRCKPPHNILSSAISYDGHYIVLSSVFELWIYHFNVPKQELLLIAKLPYPSSTMKFMPHRHQLILATLTAKLRSVTVDEHKHVSVNTLLKDIYAKDFELSADGQYLAVVTERWQVQLFDVESGTFFAKLPKFYSCPLVMAFNPVMPELIVFAGGETRDLFVYDIAKENLQCFGKVRRGEINEVYQGRTKLSHPLSVVPLSFEENLYSIYDNDCVMMFRLKCNSASSIQKSTKNHIPVQLVKSSALVLFVGTFCDMHLDEETPSKGLLVVERCQTALLQSLPPTLYRKRFGT